MAAAKATAASMKITPKAMATFRSPSLLCFCSCPLVAVGVDDEVLVEDVEVLELVLSELVLELVLDVELDVEELVVELVVELEVELLVELEVELDDEDVVVAVVLDSDHVDEGVHHTVEEGAAVQLGTPVYVVPPISKLLGHAAVWRFTLFGTPFGYAWLMSA